MSRLHGLTVIIIEHRVGVLAQPIDKLTIITGNVMADRVCAVLRIQLGYTELIHTGAQAPVLISQQLANTLVNLETAAYSRRTGPPAYNVARVA